MPQDANEFVFSSSNVNSELEAIAVDSTEIEAIEPDWVRNEPWLLGVYQASVDSLLRLRSVSGATVQRGSDNNRTSSEWLYDEEGYATNTPVRKMEFTYKDFQNLAHRRGNGYQMIDYEMSKLMAVLWFSLYGTRDAQLICGYGNGSSNVTGYRDDIGNSDSRREDSRGTKCLGFESFFGVHYEWEDNIAVNIPSYRQYMKNKTAEVNTYPTDAVWHIYDPVSKTERLVQGIKDHGYCITRVRHGRYCDIIASRVSSDNSRWASGYADGQFYAHSRSRIVGRANNSANAFGGLVFADARFASSQAQSIIGSRLAFRGNVEINE